MICTLDTLTGEVVTRTLMHEGNEVRKFYAELPRPVLVGIEAIGPMQWFLDLLEELQIECQIGDVAKIRAADNQDAAPSLLTRIDIVESAFVVFCSSAG